MNESERALREGAAVLRRSDGGLLVLTDADRVDFLQRMTTNNIAALRTGQAAVTVLTSPTAKIVHVFTVLCRDGDLLLLPGPGEAAALARYLRGQIFFMDKVSLTDRTAEHARLRVMGPHAPDAVHSLGFDAAGPGIWQERRGAIALNHPEYDVPGIELVLPDAAVEETLVALVSAGAVVIDEEPYHARRVELGRPAAGFELTGDVNPLEAGLAWACAENKGCYTGQEIIARQVTYDKVTRTLAGLRAPALLAPGTRLTADGRDVGVVTSSAHSPALDRPIALGIVKRPHNQPGATLLAGELTVEVMSLPFLSF